MSPKTVSQGLGELSPLSESCTLHSTENRLHLIGYLSAFWYPGDWNRGRWSQTAITAVLFEF